MMSPRSRREAIEQGKAELNRLYEQLPETSYDLSLRDLVEQRNTRLSFSGGLPVEERQQSAEEAATSSPPDLLPFAYGNGNIGFFSPPRSPKRPAAALVFRPAQVSPRKVSPRPSPPLSPARRSPAWSTKDQVKPIFPVISFDAVNNRCSSCSAHVIFFKTRCSSSLL